MQPAILYLETICQGRGVEHFPSRMRISNLPWCVLRSQQTTGKPHPPEILFRPGWGTRGVFWTIRNWLQIDSKLTLIQNWLEIDSKVTRKWLEIDSKLTRSRFWISPWNGANYTWDPERRDIQKKMADPHPTQTPGPYSLKSLGGPFVLCSFMARL